MLICARVHIKTTHLLRLTLSAVFAHASAFAGSKTEPSKPASGPASFADSNSLSEYFFGKANLWDSTYDGIQKWKEDNHLPISIGAHHWWNIDRNQHVYGNGYGVGTERGTYYYLLDFDPKLKLEGDGFVKEIGIHFEGRLRDSTDKLRAFYRDTIWSYEAYAYAKTDIGTFKAGQIVQNFCIGWDSASPRSPACSSHSRRRRTWRDVSLNTVPAWTGVSCCSLVWRITDTRLSSVTLMMTLSSLTIRPSL